MRIIEAAIFSQ